MGRRLTLFRMLGPALCAALVACQATSPAGVPKATAAVTLKAAAWGSPLAGTVTDAQPCGGTLKIDTRGEAILKLTARSPGADWGTPGREAAVLRLYLDGAYHQDVVLHEGDRAHTHLLGLGALPLGEHRLEARLYRPATPAALTEARIEAAEVTVVPPTDPSYPVLTHSPILEVAAKGARDNVGCLMTYSYDKTADGTEIRYEPVFSDEDGGFPAYLRMAFYGRTTDIEWTYAVKLDLLDRRVSDRYQGVLHLTHPFKGRFEAEHPLQRVATPNNLTDDGEFDAQGLKTLRLRMAPEFHTEPAQYAREEVMERYPWLYRLAGTELVRDGKAKANAATDGGLIPIIGTVLGDPRRFLVVEYRQENHGKRMGAGVTLRGDDKRYTSFRGNPLWAQTGDGWCRTAVELPRPATIGDLARLEIVGTALGSAKITNVRKVVALDDAFTPQVLPIQWLGETTVGSGGSGDAFTFFPAGL